MKRTILTVAAIAVTFAGFAFIPAQKNNALDEASIVAAAEEGKCQKRFETQTAFTKCDETWTEVTEEETVTDTLDKY